jgi:hypothetical protein
MPDQDTPVEVHEHHHDSGGGGNAMMVLLVIIVVAVLAFLAFRGGLFGGGNDAGEADVNVEVPVPDGGSEGGQQ